MNTILCKRSFHVIHLSDRAENIVSVRLRHCTFILIQYHVLFKFLDRNIDIIGLNIVGLLEEHILPGIIEKRNLFLQLLNV